MKRGPETEAALREAIKLDPSLARAWIALVSHLAQTNQIAKAEEELGFSPRDPQETLLDTVRYLREVFLVEDADNWWTETAPR